MSICGSCSVMVLRPGTGELTAFPLWCGRVCDGPDLCLECKARRDKELLREIRAEQRQSKLRWAHSMNGDAGSIGRNLARYGTRYERLPRADGTVFIFEENHKLWLAGDPLPEDKEELVEWVAWASLTPKDMRISKTRIKRDAAGNVIRWPWGRQYNKPNGRATGEVHKIRKPMPSLKMALEEAGATMRWGELDDISLWDATKEQQEKLLKGLLDEGAVIPAKRDPLLDLCEVKEDGS